RDVFLPLARVASLAGRPRERRVGPAVRENRRVRSGISKHAGELRVELSDAAASPWPGTHQENLARFSFWRDFHGFWRHVDVARRSVQLHPDLRLWRTGALRS